VQVGAIWRSFQQAEIPCLRLPGRRSSVAPIAVVKDLFDERLYAAFEGGEQSIELCYGAALISHVHCFHFSFPSIPARN